jgi:hypothetical protein
MRSPTIRPTVPTAAPRRAFLSAAAMAAAVLMSGCAPAVLATGHKVDVTVIDRETGDGLAVYPYRGQHYIAGRPGSRYAIRITNRTGERVMAVMAVDGVNIISGQTASWSQSGYVLAPWQSYEITGWRKSDQEVAAFEFTSLPDSYAARTGRPNDVGVIGVAVFTERVRWTPPPPPPSVVPMPAPEMNRQESRRSEGESAPRDAMADKKSEPLASSAAGAMAKPAQPAPAPAERLGTGHGARETSYVSNTEFERSTVRPVELIALRYDRYENLARAGIVPQYGWADPSPRPFPRSAQSSGYVPDPPSR